MYRLFLLVLFALAVPLQAALAQDYPDKIRGYKVKKTSVAVNDPDSDAKRFVTLKFGEPELGSVSVTGIALVFRSQMTVSGQSGSVDFVSFKDFEVNGIKVEIAELAEGFEFEKDVEIELPETVEVFVGAGQIARGAYSELKTSKDKWRVKGRVFVFGKFRKFGFRFKRVVPIDVDFLIRNPFARRKDLTDAAGNPGGESGIVEQ